MSRFVHTLLLLAVLALAEPAVADDSAPGTATTTHAIAMHGEPQLPPGFTHFPYVDPNAPKGGRVTLGEMGSFDSLNPFIVKGEVVAGVRELMVESLMARSLDEPFTLYGLIAERIEVPRDRSSVTFHLDPRARFSDGTPVTADDVIHSMELLREKGRPNHRTYYAKITSAERLSDRAVRFSFAPATSLPDGTDDTKAVYDREMPLIMGLMPVLAKHATDRETFDKTSLGKPLLGSGPYRIAKIDAGRSITYARNPDYWGKELPVNRGRFNFDEVRYDYYRDQGTRFEAFKIGAVDIRTEDDPSRWAESYRFEAVRSGRIKLVEQPSGLPAGMSGLVMNTRRQKLADPDVRRALIELFNFEWINRTLFHTLYRRTQSYFARSSLAALGGDTIRPADAIERELFARHGARVRPEILDGSYRFPVSDGTGHNRANARKAYELLLGAGYRLDNGHLVHPEKGPLDLEILAASSGQERLLSSFIGDLKRLGISAGVRVVDSAQYQSRLKSYDYDIIQYSWGASLSPGNEQLFRWSSKAGREPGSYNYAGVTDAAVDGIIADMLASETPEAFTSAVRALDRTLLSGDYVIPLFYAPAQWTAHWSRLAHPGRVPISGFNLDSWWIAESDSSARSGQATGAGQTTPSP